MKAVVLGFGRSGKAANAVLAARGRLRQLRAARERSRRLVTQQLADFLCVERSALSAEISRLARTGSFDCHKNHFKLT